MTINGAQVGVGCSSSTNCTSTDGCTTGTADFCIKRHDTKPDFRVSVSDCDGPLDLTDESLVLEVNMWATAKLKTAITSEDTYFALADNIGFEQIMVGDIIVMDRARRPEKMLVVAFDETNYYVKVERGYSDTDVSAWKKGSAFKIFRILNGVGEIVSVYDDVVQEDGSTENTLTTTYLSYSWDSEDTCLPGCYYLEFKLLKVNLLALSADISFTPESFTPADFDCGKSDSIEWIRRFPETQNGFLIHVIDSPTIDT